MWAASGRPTCVLGAGPTSVRNEEGAALSVALPLADSWARSVGAPNVQSGLAVRAVAERAEHPHPVVTPADCLQGRVESGALSPGNQGRNHNDGCHSLVGRSGPEREAIPTRIRATAVSFCFNAPRFIAFAGPLVAGTLVTAFGDYGRAAVMVGTIYLVGIVGAPFFPETRGRPLPE